MFASAIGMAFPRPSAPETLAVSMADDPLVARLANIMEGVEHLSRSGPMYSTFFAHHGIVALYERLRSEALVPWEALQDGGDEQALRTLAKHRNSVDGQGAG